jgi:DNA helicase-2/ATP-dependent DNA helicase PcrA
MIKEILKNIVDSSGAHAAQNGKFDLQENLAAELISKAKAKGLSPEDIKIKAEKDMEKREPLPKGEFSPDVWLKVSRVYAKYAAECKKNNMLDFDDLLVCGVKLLKARPTCVDCYHIFVDEFQDTNTTQFELMCLFAQIHRNVSIVGDPDQSSELPNSFFRRFADAC